MILLFAALALASDPQATAPAKPGGSKPKMICVDNTPLGSRIPGARICKTAEQWRVDQHEYRDETERAQRTNIIHGG